MQKKSICHSAFFTPRALVTLVLFGAVCSVVTGTLLAFLRPETPAPVSRNTLTFAERVAYQRAIEQVYWRNRIWPKQRPDAKPSLAAVMSQAEVENKVGNYLRESQALEDYWQRPFTAEQLQAEMDRMAKHTKQPEVLREIFAALGNDPFVIAECLAKPLLSERLLAKLSGHDERLQSELRAEGQLKVIAVASANYTLPAISESPNGCIYDTWTATSTLNAPDGREVHTAVWTGTEMIVWGGYNGSALNTGGTYAPSKDSWTGTSTTNQPS